MGRYIKTTVFITASFLTVLPVFAGEESLSFTGKLPPTRVVPLNWGKDPFVPLVKNVAAPDLKLKAIFYSSQNPSAIINERIVYRGSVIGGQKVIDIGRTHVILQGEAGEVRLEIAGGPELPDGGK